MSIRLPLSEPSGQLVGEEVVDARAFVAARNPTTGKPVTPAELHAYARDVLRLDDLFWGTEEPYYSRDVLPFLRGRARE